MSKTLPGATGRRPSPYSSQRDADWPLTTYRNSVNKTEIENQ